MRNPPHLRIDRIGTAGTLFRLRALSNGRQVADPRLTDLRSLKPHIPIRRAPDASSEVVDEGADLHRHELFAGIDGIDRAGWRLPGIEHAAQRAGVQRLSRPPCRQYGDADAVERGGAQHLRLVAAETG